MMILEIAHCRWKGGVVSKVGPYHHHPDISSLVLQPQRELPIVLSYLYNHIQHIDIDIIIDIYIDINCSLKTFCAPYSHI